MGLFKGHVVPVSVHLGPCRQFSLPEDPINNKHVAHLTVVFPSQSSSSSTQITWVLRARCYGRWFLMFPSPAHSEALYNLVINITRRWAAVRRLHSAHHAAPGTASAGRSRGIIRPTSSFVDEETGSRAAPRLYIFLFIENNVVSSTPKTSHVYR